MIFVNFGAPPKRAKISRFLCTGLKQVQIWAMWTPNCSWNDHCKRFYLRPRPACISTLQKEIANFLSTLFNEFYKDILSNTTKIKRNSTKIFCQTPPKSRGMHRRKLHLNYSQCRFPCMITRELISTDQREWMREGLWRLEPLMALWNLLVPLMADFFPMPPKLSGNGGSCGHTWAPR